MTTNRSKAGGPARRAPGPRTWARPPGLALLGLALLGLIQSGCVSDGCSTCGLGSRISQGVQAMQAGIQSGVQSIGGIFRHKRGCGGGNDCGCGGVGEGVVVDSGIPVTPGAMAIPAPGTIVPAPAIESAPTQLEPIPSTSRPTRRAGPAPILPSPRRAGCSRTGITGRATPRCSRRDRGRMSPGRSIRPQKRRTIVRPQQRRPDLFANIPPVDLPSEVTRKAVGTAVGSTPASSPAPSPTPLADSGKRRPDRRRESFGGGGGDAHLAADRCRRRPTRRPGFIASPRSPPRSEAARPLRSKGSTGSRKKATGRSSTSEKAPKSNRISSTR